MLRTAEQLALVLRHRRKALGLTQLELAARMGLSQKRLSALERHPEQLSVRQLLDLTALLNIRLTLGEDRSPGLSTSESIPTEPTRW
ncbi:MAG: helix-turn-helix domain-containing protein [Casimicrobiaceae bacterium]